VDRGQDFAVYERVTSVAGTDGRTTSRTNRFTLIENGLHYFEDGVWKESRDLIEPFREGAIARYGPHQAIFSPDLNADAVFDIQMADGGRLRGGVRAIQATDLKTGRSVVLAKIKASAPGELAPPDRVVYPDAFEGLKADVVMIWRHNLFSQDVVVRQRPALPRGWEAATTRFEVVTELVECPEPTIRAQQVGRDGKSRLEDDVVLSFGGMDMLMGHGFGVEGKRACALGGLRPIPGAIPVRKQYRRLSNGRRFLIESVPWAQAEAQWTSLPGSAGTEVTQQMQAGQTTEVQTAKSDALPSVEADERAATSTSRASRESFDGMEKPGPDPFVAFSRSKPQLHPITAAKTAYVPTGFVVDFVIVPSGSVTTFESGQTYYIQSSYYCGDPVAFEPGCTIKFKENAYMLLYGPVYFPDLGPHPVFTSKDDDMYGDRIFFGDSDPDNSDGDPSDQRASRALWLYYVNFATTVQNALIRWAQKGIQYDMNPGIYVTHTLQNAIFENCDIGVYANLADSTLILDNVKKCNVGDPVYCYYSACNVYGWMTEQCGTDYQDSDGDLLSDWEEFIWGTDPFDPYTISPNKKDGEFLLTAVAGEGGTRLSLSVIQANYDPTTDTTSLEFIVGGTYSNEYVEIYVYDSQMNSWRNIHAIYSGTNSDGDVYAVTLRGDQTGDTFAAFSAYDDDADGLSDGYEVMVTQTIVGNPDSSSSAPGVADTKDNGIADGDEDLDGDVSPISRSGLWGQIH